MAEAFQYEIDWPAAGQRPGHHRSSHVGPGLEFRGYEPLLAAPDARHIDLLASLKDPLGRWMVRTYRQRSALAMFVLADLSASMGATVGMRKLDVLADFVESAAESAWRTGDAFGFLGCDESLRRDFHFPASHGRGVGAFVAGRLRAFEPTGISAEGLLESPAWLAHKRSLVFLVSDFHWSLTLLESVLDRLARHHVVPVVLWDRDELAPTAGPLRIAVVRDPESGRTRTLLLRSSVRRRLVERFRERHESMSRIFGHRGMRPLLVTDGFRAERVTRYFAGARSDVPLRGM